MASTGAFVATALTLWAVSADDANPSLQAHPDRAEIVGGTETGTGKFEAVVAVLANQDLCTGTVVSPRVVMTAGHCLSGVDEASDIEVFYGQQLSSTNRIEVASFGVHPDFCAQPDCGNEIFDYGFVTLAEDFEVDEIILPIVDQDEWDQTIGVGGAVTIVGYGQDPSVEEQNNGIGTKRQVTTWISSLTSRGYEFSAGGDQRDSCVGDSGGPAVVQLTSGEWRLAGIVSRGSNPCGDGGIYAVPYPALTWLRDETELDLCGDACGTCDCLETAPPSEEGCNTCSVDDSPGGAAPVLLLTLLGLRRRRQR